MYRRCLLASIAGAALVGGLLGGCGGSKPARTGPPATAPTTRSVPRTPGACPLTGQPAPGGVPARPALAVKLDNLPAARPQYGLRSADIVYEEPVEGGLTRFIAIFQCRDATRVEPIRSARIIDPQIVEQYGAHPLFAYAGGIDAAVAAVASSPLVDVGTARAPAGTYRRDPARSAPHNLYSSTAALYAAGQARHAPEVAPPAPFGFGPEPAGAAPAATLRIAYPASPVSWTWQAGAGEWARSYPSGPAAAAEGGTLSAANVIVVSVVMYPSAYVEDPSGVHENLLTLTGSGPVQVLRDGSVITGTWQRAALSERTRYLDGAGRPIPMAPGPTWVELVPTTVAVTRTP